LIENAYIEVYLYMDPFTHNTTNQRQRQFLRLYPAVAADALLEAGTAVISAVLSLVIENPLC
jgi:hypothetical protein